MSKYDAIYSDIWKIFDTVEWKAEAIPSYPTDMIQASGVTNFIKISQFANYEKLQQTSGLLEIDIYINAGDGPKQANIIADKLDKYLANKTRTTGLTGSTQFFESSLAFFGTDKANPSLSRYRYTIPFNYYGN